MTGALAHAVYNVELERISQEWLGAHEHDDNLSGVTQTELVDQCLYALKYFTFHPGPLDSGHRDSLSGLGTTSLIKSAFHSCAARHPFLLVSSMGVQDANNIRLHDSLLSGLLKRTPTLPTEIYYGAPEHVNHLTASGRIKDITTQDVLEELKGCKLSETELGTFMAWWIKAHRHTSSQNQDVRVPGTDATDDTKQFIAEASFIAKDMSGNQQTVRLSSIEKVSSLEMGPSFPRDSPLPAHTLPFEVVTVVTGATSQEFQHTLEDIKSIFRWEALTVFDWLKSISAQSSSAFDICSSPDWAEQVLSVVAHNWQCTSPADRDGIALHLKEKTCIPTQLKMHKPSDVYLTAHSPVSDFPTVKFPGGAKVHDLLEPVLQKLGIKNSVGIEIVCERCVHQPCTGTCSEPSECIW